MILTIMAGISLCAMPAQAQFNTVASVPGRYKVEVLREGTDKAEPTPAGTVPVQGAPVDIPASASPVESRKEIRELRSMANLFIGGVRVAPPEVFGNSAGEQHVLLQHHGYCCLCSRKFGVRFQMM